MEPKGVLVGRRRSRPHSRQKRVKRAALSVTWPVTEPEVRKKLQAERVSQQ